MARFIRTFDGKSLLNVDRVDEFYLDDDFWFAKLRDGDKRKICIDQDHPNGIIELAAATIVPTAVDEELHYFHLREEDGSLIHARTRIIAWAIGGLYPAPVTADGVATLGWDDASKFMYLIQHPDGRYDDIIDMSFDDEEAINNELERRAAAG